MKLKNTISTLSLVLFLAVTGFSQKFGYLNSSQLLLELPAIKTANEQLGTYQKTLVGKGETMVKAFEVKYNEYVAAANSGELSKIQMQQKEADLGQEQQKIQQYEQEVAQKIEMKREELYKPILDKVKAVLEQIGKEQGYTMIFDTSTGSLLHANEADNLMATVKSKLGI